MKLSPCSSACCTQKRAADEVSAARLAGLRSLHQRVVAAEAKRPRAPSDLWGQRSRKKLGAPRLGAVSVRNTGRAKERCPAIPRQLSPCLGQSADRRRHSIREGRSPDLYSSQEPFGSAART